MRKYLVTGAAGFIGSNFVKYLLRKYGEQIEIVILDALTYAGNLTTIKDEIALPNVTFVKGTSPTPNVSTLFSQPTISTSW